MSWHRVGERGGGSVILRRFGIGMGADALNGVSRRVVLWRAAADALIVPMLSEKRDAAEESAYMSTAGVMPSTI